MDQRQESSVIQTIVQKNFEDETTIAGPKLVHQLIEQRDSPAKPVRLPGGHDFELGKTIEVIIAAIQLTKSLLDAYVALRKAKGRTPTPEEVVERQTAQAKAVGIAEVEAKKEQLAQSVVASVAA